jgi:Family of unknown function (DUF5675)
MEIRVIRQPKKGLPTMGELFIDGEFFCYTLEDEDRGILQGMSISRVKELKRYGDTCIGYGTYKVLLTGSVKFKRILPLLMKVDGFEGIRIHRGNTKEHTLGCILVGYGVENYTVTHSRQCEIDLIKKLTNIENIQITLTK